MDKSLGASNLSISWLDKVCIDQNNIAHGLRIPCECHGLLKMLVGYVVMTHIEVIGRWVALRSALNLMHLVLQQTSRASPARGGHQEAGQEPSA